MGALLCLAFFEGGLLFGLSVAAGKNDQNEKYYTKIADEYTQVLPLIQTAKAKGSDGDPFFASSLPEGAPDSVTQKTLNVPILMYHHINTTWDTKDSYGRGLTVNPIKFEEQISYLTKQGYNTISLTDLYDAMYRDGSIPAKPIILTFDDGYRDNYDYAFRILQKYGKKGTFFVISNAVSGNSYLTADQIKEMSKAGMEIQSHTKTHAELGKANVTKLTVELALSKKEIEKLTEKTVSFVAYPYGQYNEKVIQIAKSQGYLMGLGVVNGRLHDNRKPFYLNRIQIGPNIKLPAFINLVSF